MNKYFGVAVIFLLVVIIFLMIRSEKQDELDRYRKQYIYIQQKANQDIKYMSIDEMNELYEWVTKDYPKQDSILRTRIIDLQNSIWMLK